MTSLDPHSGETQVALNWADDDLPDPHLDTYRIYAGATPGGEGASPIATDGVLTYSELLCPATTRYYQVSTVVDGVEGPWSNEVQVTVPPLGAPMLTVVSAKV
jgi:hypothetical protein